MTLPLIITALFGISLAWLVRLALTAPLGWENASGFHYGAELFENTGAGLPNADQLTRPVSAPFHSSTISREAQDHHEA